MTEFGDQKIALGLCLLALGDVHAHAGKFLRFAFAVEHDLAERFQPPYRAIGPNHAIRHCIILSRGDRFSDLAGHQRYIVGMDVAFELLERPPERAGLESVNELEAGRPIHAAGVDIPLPCAHATGV